MGFGAVAPACAQTNVKTKLHRLQLHKTARVKFTRRKNDSGRCQLQSSRVRVDKHKN